MTFFHLLKQSIRCRCPRCGEGRLYRSFFDLRLNDHCSKCGLNLADNDSADGPAVFLIFVLGFTLVPAAVFMDWAFHFPLWVHAVIWGSLALLVTLGALKPLKSLVLLIQYRTRPESWRA